MTSTVRIALLSDIHADVHALQDALTQIDRLGGVDSIFCAGDLVGVGCFPEETLALLKDRAVICVAGNHDRWCMVRQDSFRQQDEEQNAVHDASGWDLSDEALSFLEHLPGLVRFERAGVRVAVCHGTPASDMEGVDPHQVGADDLERWLGAACADVLHVGHIHTAFALSIPGGGMVVNPGSLGREGQDTGVRPWLFARDRETFVPAPLQVRGTFGLLLLPGRTFTVHRASDGEEVAILRKRLGVVDRRGR